MQTAGLRPDQHHPLGTNLNDAAALGDLGQVRRLLSTGSDVHARGTLSRTCLHFTAEAGRADLCDVLIAAGAEVNALDYKGFTPLHKAAGFGAASAVRSLLAAGADPEVTSTYLTTPLHEIASGGGMASGDARVWIVAMLLDAGCQLDARDSSGRTPLWYAAATGTTTRPPGIDAARLAVVDELLRRGADPRVAAAGKQGTPVDAAHGRHQSRAYARVWPEAVALLQSALDRTRNPG
jgi:hypothetical protein